MNIPALTQNERMEALALLDAILSDLVLMKSEDDKRRQEEELLAAELRREWRRAYDYALKEIAVILSSMPDGVAQDVFDLLNQAMLDNLGPAFGQSQSVRKIVQNKINNSFLLGKEEINANHVFNLLDKKAIDALTRFNCFWLGKHYGDHIGPEIARVAQDAFTQGLGRKALADELQSRFKDVLGNYNYQYWDVVSSAALVRARTFGNVYGLAEANILEFEIMAMHDERMCNICGQMDGRIFNVAQAKKLIDDVIGVDDPEAFKEAMPWHSEPPIGVSSKELAGKGMHLPPFHGRCRCLVLSRQKAGERLIGKLCIIDPNATKKIDYRADKGKLGQETLTAVKALTTDELVNQVNACENAVWPQRERDRHFGKHASELSVKTEKEYEKIARETMLTAERIFAKLDDKKKRLQFVFAKETNGGYTIAVADGGQIYTCYGKNEKHPSLNKRIKHGKTDGWVELKGWVTKQ